MTSNLAFWGYEIIIFSFYNLKIPGKKNNFQEPSQIGGFLELLITICLSPQNSISRSSNKYNNQQAAIL